MCPTATPSSAPLSGRRCPAWSPDGRARSAGRTTGRPAPPPAQRADRRELLRRAVWHLDLAVPGRAPRGAGDLRPRHDGAVGGRSAGPSSTPTTSAGSPPSSTSVAAAARCSRPSSPRHPHLRGVAVRSTRRRRRHSDDLFERAGVAGRCTRVGGDFFTTVPDGGDAYMLKAVIHDWPDAESVAILRTVRRHSRTRRAPARRTPARRRARPGAGRLLGSQHARRARGPGTHPRPAPRPAGDGAGSISPPPCRHRDHGLRCSRRGRGRTRQRGDGRARGPQARVHHAISNSCSTVNHG